MIKSLGGNVKMLVTNPKEEEEAKKKKDGKGVSLLTYFRLHISQTSLTPHSVICTSHSITQR